MNRVEHIVLAAKAELVQASKTFVYAFVDCICIFEGLPPGFTLLESIITKFQIFQYFPSMQELKSILQKHVCDELEWNYSQSKKNIKLHI
mmetsp:Transcript_31308/g.63645  ORF Transcript_31308/g.63645 Transcript_31308/m.63645 type:complete len:90 (-) Transcript_31308:627-896(-)